MTEGNSPKVLVLLAMFNGRVWIEEQLESIVNQTGVNISVLISDDKSTDKCDELLKASIESSANLHLVTNSESSGSAGQNFFRLIRECDCDQFDYIAFSDQDDTWLTDKLVAGIECLENSTASGYSSSALAVWPSGKEKLVSQVRKTRNLDFLFEGAGQGCTFILKSEFFGYIKKFCVDNREVTNRFYYHDWLVYILARASDVEWFFDERSFIRYRQHATNDTGAKGSIEAVRSRWRLISNGWYKSQVEIALDISKLVIKNSADLDDFEEIFSGNDSLSRRLTLAKFFIVNGRRKTTDRIVLAIAALLGLL
ncbi:MAG: glycosyltransferase [Halieaceae bacterium]|nr:glycosyltransferase [Halieaceae bacterium]